MLVLLMERMEFGEDGLIISQHPDMGIIKY